MKLTVRKSSLNGTVQAPPSKSHTHRAPGHHRDRHGPGGQNRDRPIVCGNHLGPDG